MNTPLVLDPLTHKLFLVGRKPGTLAVLDTRTGKVDSTAPSVDVADDMTFDAAGQRLFVTGAGGLAVYRRADAEHFIEVQRLDTKGGKTSIYVEPLHQFYVVHTTDGLTTAALEIYSVASAAGKKAPR